MHAECHEDAASWNQMQDTLAEHPECCNVMLGEYLVASSRMASSTSKPGSSSRAGKDAHSRMTTPNTPKMQEKGGAVRVTWTHNTQFTCIAILNLLAQYSIYLRYKHNRGGVSLLHIASLMDLTKMYV